jgi:pimeloyl-ACP methyl ester carboxylesterase
MDGPFARKIPQAIAAVIALALLATACTTDSSGASDTGYTPKFASTECPGRVVASSTREMRCGYLTVPEDRSNPSGRKIRDFVVRVEPTSATNAPPVIFAGGHLGSPLDYADLSAVADHLAGPELIGLEPRGTGYSEPNLSCPEVDAVAPRTLSAPIGDHGLRETFLKAVKACHDRFNAQGVDLSAFGVQQAGADLVDLVRALGLTRWDVLTKGSTSRILFAAMRTHPAGLRAIVAYNPEFPDTDTFTQAIVSTRAAISELEALCDADGRCGGRFPHLSATFDVAIRRFDAQPRTVRIEGNDIVVDGARLLRDFRNLLSTIASDEQMYLHLPATIDALAHAKDPTRPVVAVVSAELEAPTFCAGFLPACGGQMSLGAYYSALCTDIAPFSDRATLLSLAGGATAWTEDYVNGPYRDLCGAWEVTAADESVTTRVASDVPMLVFAGELDPSVTPSLARDGLAAMPNAFLVDIPVLSDGVTQPHACENAPSARNDFLADPTSAPDAACWEHFQPRFASSPL